MPALKFELSILGRPCVCIARIRQFENLYILEDYTIDVLCMDVDGVEHATYYEICQASHDIVREKIANIISTNNKTGQQ